jgi:prepilin-type processing-associated H-X9-DG protein
MEQSSAYNAINWNFGSRWSDNAPAGMSEQQPPGDGSMGAYGMVQYTVLTMQVNSFLCPSDSNPGSSGRAIFPNGSSKIFAASNYPVNVGLNRRINGGTPGANWQINGPTYIATNWDGALKPSVGINTFVDGTSNTVIFSEWIKGPATGLPSRNSLAIVYNLTQNSDAFNTDYQFKLACDQLPILTASQNFSWKGEWWTFGPTTIYSHTQTPNRTSCAYADMEWEWKTRGDITLVSASSNHPGGVNTLFMDGSVRFVKSSVSYQSWYGIATPNGGEVVSADAL